MNNVQAAKQSQLLKMESFDALQIFDQRFKDKLVYEIKYYDDKEKKWKIKYELTYIGIKQLTYEKSQKGEGLIIIGEPKAERRSIDENPKNDVWYAEIRLKNIKTLHEAQGYSEASVFPWENYPVIDPKTGKKIFNKDTIKYETVYEQRYDPFGRTAATGKARRNAERQHLPEMGIQLFVEKAIEKMSNVQNVDEIPDSKEYDFCACKEPATKLDGTCNTCKKVVRPKDVK